jgi:hypothetical protein
MDVLLPVINEIWQLDYFLALLYFGQGFSALDRSLRHRTQSPELLRKNKLGTLAIT